MSDQSQENDEVKTINRKQIMNFSLTVLVLAWVHVVVSISLGVYNFSKTFVIPIINPKGEGGFGPIVTKGNEMKKVNIVGWLVSTLVCIAIGVIATWTYLRAKDGRICPLDECVSPIEVV